MAKKFVFKKNTKDRSKRAKDVGFVTKVVLFFLIALLLGYLNYRFLITNSYDYPPSQQTVMLGTRISNFLMQSMNPPNNTVSGLLYILYPVAYANGVPITLHLGDTVGYICDGSEWRLSNIDFYNKTATFSYIREKIGPCPI